jgi:hypothetical protein
LGKTKIVVLWFSCVDQTRKIDRVECGLSHIVEIKEIKREGKKTCVYIATLGIKEKEGDETKPTKIECV